MLDSHGSSTTPSGVLVTAGLIAFAAIAVLAFWGTSRGLGRVPAAAGYRLQGYWTGAGAPGGALLRPIGVAVASDGSVYVTDARERVVHFSPAGTVLSQWGQEGSGPGQFSNPVGIAVASDGSVYVSDYDLDRVEEFTAAGGFLLQFGRHGGAAGELDAPAGLAIGRSGSVYVADFYNHRVEEFSAQGRFIRAFGAPGRLGLAALHYPTGVAILPQGGILVADAYNYEIQWLASTGEAFRRVGHRLFDSWPRPASGSAGFNVPTDAAVGPQGLISVADSANHRIVLLSPDGSYEAEWRIPAGSRAIFSPEHLALSPDGRTVYATDFANNRLIVLGVTETQ